MGKKRDRLATHPKRIRSVERQAEAMELRKAGATYAMIAEQLGYSDGHSAAQSIRSALQKAIREPAEELREMELERLDHIMLVLWPKVNAGDMAAIDRAMRVQLRIAELAGYDRAIAKIEQSNVIIIGGDSDDYIDNLKALRDESMKKKKALNADADVIEVEAVES